MSNENQLTSVRAKFRCDVVTHHSGGNKGIQMQAEYSKDGENKDFVDSTPSGRFEMQIATGKPAGEFFQPGKKYYLTFTEAPDA